MFYNVPGMLPGESVDEYLARKTTEGELGAVRERRQAKWRRRRLELLIRKRHGQVMAVFTVLLLAAFAAAAAAAVLSYLFWRES